MIRAKITPIFVADGVRILIQWVRIENELPGEVIAEEEFAIAASRSGSSYVSAVEVESAVKRKGTFWIDEAGLRHFIIVAEPGDMGVFGTEL